VNINTSLEGDGGEPCPTETTLALQVIILILIVIIVFFIIKHLKRKDKSQPMSKKTFGVLLIVIILLFSILAIYFTDTGEVTKAPEFTLTDIDGNTFNLTDYKGQVVILDMMSIPCTGCKEVEEDLQEIYPEYKDEVVFISIDILREDTNEMLREYRDKKDIDWTVARDTDDIILKYNVDGIPKVVIIDKEGYATYEHRGETHVGTLKDQLDLAIEGRAEAVSIQQASFFSLAIFAGIASFFSPCSFPMLPGYIAYYLKKDSEAGGTIPMRKAAISGTVSAAGIIIVYVTVGIVVLFAGASVIQNIGYFMIVVGVLLIVLGALMFTPLQYWKIVRPFQALWAKIRGLGDKKDASGTDSSTGAAQSEKGEPGFYSGLLLYGLGYGAAASGCTAPLFIAVMSLAIVSGLFMGILILVLYTSAAALLMIGVTVTIAYFGAGAAQKLSKYTEIIKKFSGAVLVIVGIFLIWMFISTL
jgi:cytochrome c-type biogenesis protein